MLDPKQLVWRCRRGVRELDVLFARYLEVEYPQLNPKQKAAFERLLEVQDPTIMDWLFGRSETDDREISEIIHQLKVISGLTT